jgi:hypothetical protein
MRWFIGGAVTLLLVAGVYLASPFWAVWDLASAVEGRDAARIANRVNFRALRVSLAKQVVAEAAAAKPGQPGLGPQEAGLAASTIAALGDPLLEQLVSPEGVVGLLDRLSPDGGRALPNLSSPAGGRGDLWRLMKASRWRGFRNVYFTLPLRRAGAASARLQLRLGRLKWRLVAIELSPDSRRQLLADLARRHADRSRRD